MNKKQTEIDEMYEKLYRVYWELETCANLMMDFDAPTEAMKNIKDAIRNVSAVLAALPISAELTEKMFS
jgi:hypothetical protein